MARTPQYNEQNSLDLLWNPRQMEFLAAAEAVDAEGAPQFDRLSLFAGRRGGKTKIGGVAVAKLAMRRPNQYGWVCAPTYDDLYDFVYPAVFSVIPKAWVKDWVASHRELILKNNTRIAFRSLDDPNKARGPGLDFLWIDEARKISEDAWYTAAPALADKKGIAIITTTPNGFDWCWEAFWKPAEENEPGYWACKYKTVDNPAFDPREAERNRKSMDPVFFAQEFEADFVTFTGSIYGGSLEPQILTNEADIKRIIPEYPLFDGSRRGIVGLDPGADHPFAGVYLADIPPFGLVAVGEYAERNRAIRQHVDGIQQMLFLRAKQDPNIERFVMDRTQRQTFIELGQFGMYPTPADQADVVDGIRRVQSWLGARRLWFVQPWTPRLVSDLRSYRWAEMRNAKGETTKERPVKRKDDLPDALRYAVMGWPEMPAWEREAEDALRSFTRRGTTPEEQWMFDRVAKLNRDERYPKQAKQGIGEFYGDDGRDSEIDDSQMIADSLWHNERVYGDDY